MIPQSIPIISLNIPYNKSNFSNCLILIDNAIYLPLIISMLPPLFNVQKLFVIIINLSQSPIQMNPFTDAAPPQINEQFRSSQTNYLQYQQNSQPSTVKPIKMPKPVINYSSSRVKSTKLVSADEAYSGYSVQQNMKKSGGLDTAQATHGHLGQFKSPPRKFKLFPPSVQQPTIPKPQISYASPIEQTKPSSFHVVNRQPLVFKKQEQPFIEQQQNTVMPVMMPLHIDNSVVSNDGDFDNNQQLKLTDSQIRSYVSPDPQQTIQNYENSVPQATSSQYRPQLLKRKYHIFKQQQQQIVNDGHSNQEFLQHHDKQELPLNSQHQATIAQPIKDAPQHFIQSPSQQPLSNSQVDNYAGDGDFESRLADRSRQRIFRNNYSEYLSKSMANNNMQEIQTIPMHESQVQEGTEENHINNNINNNYEIGGEVNADSW